MKPSMHTQEKRSLAGSDELLPRGQVPQPVALSKANLALAQTTHESAEMPPIQLEYEPPGHLRQSDRP